MPKNNADYKSTKSKKNDHHTVQSFSDNNSKNQFDNNLNLEIEFLRQNITELENKIIELEKTKNEYLVLAQKTQANFLNYKNDEDLRRNDYVKFGRESVFVKILSILDNFEITEQNLPSDLKENINIKGLLQIKEQIKVMLKSYGIEEIDCLGKKFDPSLAEALSVVEQENVEPDIVLAIIQKGYKIDNKLLRPAKVSVSK